MLLHLVFRHVWLCPYLVVPAPIEFHLIHLCSPNYPRLVPLLKGIVHQKIYSSSSRSKPVWMCLFWTQRKIFWRMRETEQYFSPTIEVNDTSKQPDYKLSSEYLPLCSEQTHSYRFGSTWGWVNDRIFIFGWTIPLSPVFPVSSIRCWMSSWVVFLFIKDCLFFCSSPYSCDTNIICKIYIFLFLLTNIFVYSWQ